jgi:DNA-binding GntR family transcriptional regulator
VAQRTPLANQDPGRQIARPVTLRQSAYQAILDMIIDRTLQPGQHLVENELASMLNVSRQPVREALQWLQNDGWVDLRPGYGAFVRQPTVQEADQLLAVRTLMEAEAARLAARNATDAELAELRELYERGVAALDSDDLSDMVEANASLHAAITRCSGNQILVELSGQVERRVRWYYTPVARHRGKQSWIEHEQLLEAIAAHDAERAQSLMRAHTEQTRQAYLERAAATNNSVITDDATN